MNLILWIMAYAGKLVGSRISRVALAPLLGLIGSFAVAAPINVEISIEITGMYEARYLGEDENGRPQWENIGVVESSFLPGSILQSANGLFVSLSYDPATPLQAIVGEGTHAIYGNAVGNLALLSGEFSLPNELLPIVSRGSAGVINDYYINGMDARTFYQTFISANWFASLFIELRDSSGLLYSSLDLPTDIDFSQFDESQVNFGIVDRYTRDQLQLVGRVTDIRTTQVPEPGTLALLGLGLVGMGYGRRRKAS